MRLKVAKVSTNDTMNFQVSLSTWRAGMRKLLASIMAFFRKTPKPGKWESIGSPGYRNAIQRLRYNIVTEIRRKAWGNRRYLAIPAPNVHIYADYTDGQGPKDAERYPPGFRIIHYTDTARWGKEYWQVPDEDVNADDWQVQEFGKWVDV